MPVQVRLARPDELASCIDLRALVFVQEQSVPVELEVDGLDPSCTHFIALDGDQLVGTARMKVLGPGTVKAQRVAVRASVRGTGAGKAIMRAMERHARELGFVRIVLDAQLSAVGFYERLGYHAEGPVFVDAGIDHRHMWRSLELGDAIPGPVILLGPQRPTPNLGRVLESLGAPATHGPAVVITAGWRHDEGTSESLARVVGPDAISLPLYSWFEQIGAILPEARRGHHDAQERVRRIKAAHRVRLRNALRSVRALWEMAVRPSSAAAMDPSVFTDRTSAIGDEIDAAIEEVRALDARFLEQLRSIERPDPLQFDAVRALHARAARRIREARVVMVAGGHVGVLASRMAFFGIPGLLRDANRKGTPIVGWSGGAMVLTPRVVLFHDDPPEGSGDAELLGDGAGLVGGIVALPHARARLDLHDRIRVATLARRFGPAQCVGVENGAWLSRTSNGWENAGDPGTAVQLGVDGSALPLPAAPAPR